MKRKPTIKELQAEIRTLKKDMNNFCAKIRHPRTITMWTWPKQKLTEGWRLDNLSERVFAAEQLGFDVVLENNDVGLRVIYKKKHPEVPFW
jgi:hypothetical protein